MENYEHEEDIMEEPIGYLYNSETKNKIKVYKPIGWFRKLMWLVLGFEYHNV